MLLESKPWYCKNLSSIATYLAVTPASCAGGTGLSLAFAFFYKAFAMYLHQQRKHMELD